MQLKAFGVEFGLASGRDRCQRKAGETCCSVKFAEFGSNICRVFDLGARFIYVSKVAMAGYFPLLFKIAAKRIKNPKDFGKSKE